FFNYDNTGDKRDSTRGIWWNYGTKYDAASKTYVTDYNDRSPVIQHSVDGTLGGFKSIMENTSGHNIFTDSASGTGGSIVATFDLVSENSFTTGSYTGKNVGTIDISFSYNQSETEQEIINRFNAMNGADIFASSSYSNNSDSGETSTSYMNTYGSSYGRNSIDVPVYSYPGDAMQEWIQEGANDEQGLSLNYMLLSNEVLGINNLNVLTFDKAQEAINLVDGALEIINSERSKFGAYENRMSYAYNYAKNAEENLQSSESAIRDTDIAKEISEFSKNSILEQAGIAMMSQANQSSQSVLSLLK
ncbi:MAG: hypothetical protein K6G63_07880, partial [Eubacterium sp.]|nr:hypothetical protein [Eubacterium sp.]